MKKITISKREVEVAYETDVLVVGGGPGGIGAAVSAARSGVKTILIEKKNCLGGIMTGGLMNAFEGVDYDLHRGIYLEVVNRLKERNAILSNTWLAQMYDREETKLLFEQMCQEAGVRVYYHTTFVESIVEDSTIKGVIVNSIAGTQAILAKVVIDCSRHGSVGKSAGAEMIYSSPDLRDGYLTRFGIRNIDYGKVMILLHEDDDYYSDATEVVLMPKMRAGRKTWYTSFMGGENDLQAAIARGEYKFNKWTTINSGMVEPDNRMEVTVWVANSESIVENEKGRIISAFNDELGEYDMGIYTDFEMSVKEYAHALTEYLRNNVSGFKNAVVDITSDEVFVFGGRIKGDHILNEDEMFKGTEYEDSVIVGFWFIDVALKRRFDCVPHDVPYRCFYSKNIDNLMTAGATLSADHYGFFTIASQNICLLSGQAAGTAAAQAIKTGKKPRDIDVKVLQSTLRSLDVKTGIRDLAPGVMQRYIDDAEELRARRASGEPEARKRIN